MPMFYKKIMQCQCRCFMSKLCSANADVWCKNSHSTVCVTDADFWYTFLCGAEPWFPMLMLYKKIYAVPMPMFYEKIMQCWCQCCIKNIMQCWCRCLYKISHSTICVTDANFWYKFLCGAGSWTPISNADVLCKFSYSTFCVTDADFGYIFLSDLESWFLMPMFYKKIMQCQCCLICG